MKTYEKPTLAVLSISASDMLCGSTCTIATRGNDDWFFKYLDREFGNNDGFLEPSDHVFGDGETGCTEIAERYCKFTTDGGIVFTS